MQRFAHIANEAEFQEWLTWVLEEERSRLREGTTARESRKQTSFEVVMEKHNEGDRAS
jgi:hypothetical protein